MAAVDSEMTLIMAGPYQKSGWLPNPFNLGFERLPVISRVRAKTLMVGRLDGPTPATARRLVDDALEVERTGLSGVFYLDARGLKGQATPGGYVWFDQHLLHLSDLLKKYSDLKVVLDQKPGLFPPGSCPDAALYCGWYSLANYVPAFTWNKGAVGYHVASSEATTLKKPGSQSVVQTYAGRGGGRHPGAGGRTLPVLLSPPGPVFPPAHDRKTDLAGGLLPHRAPGVLDANPHRRPLIPTFQEPSRHPASQNHPRTRPRSSTVDTPAIPQDRQIFYASTSNVLDLPVPPAGGPTLRPAPTMLKSIPLMATRDCSLV